MCFCLKKNLCASVLLSKKNFCAYVLLSKKNLCAYVLLSKNMGFCLRKAGLLSKKTKRRFLTETPSLHSKSCYVVVIFTRGRRWIRTTEGINQQIYSLPHLATLVFALEEIASFFVPRFLTLQS